MDLQNRGGESPQAAAVDGSPSEASAVAAENLLEDVYRRHKRSIVRLLRRHVPSDEAAENVFHEACRVTYERLLGRGIRDSEHLAGFLYGTARRLARADRRRFDNSRTESNVAVLESLSDPAADVSIAREKDERAAAVRRLLQELPVERDRHVLVRLYLDERDKDEICAELGLSDEHFSRVLFRAKLRFRAILERHGIETLGPMLGLLLLACTVVVPSGR
ncbi:MAG: sigma-70 family RNA polymerase sigma factor [Steroidobacteraceae bacterium]